MFCASNNISQLFIASCLIKSNGGYTLKQVFTNSAFLKSLLIPPVCKLAICKLGQILQMFSNVMEHGKYFNFIHYIYILCKKYASDSS